MAGAEEVGEVEEVEVAGSVNLEAVAAEAGEALGEAEVALAAVEEADFEVVEAAVDSEAAVGELDCVDVGETCGTSSLSLHKFKMNIRSFTTRVKIKYVLYPKLQSFYLGWLGGKWPLGSDIVQSSLDP